MSTQPPVRRRFLPIPIETTFKSHKQLEIDSIDPSTHDTEPAGEDSNPTIRVQLDEPQKPKRRFLPQPIETTQRSNRAVAVKPAQDTPNTTTQDVPPAIVKSSARTRPRFAPQLIETTRRSKRVNDVHHTPPERTDVTPGSNNTYQSGGRSRTKPDQHLLSPHDIRASSLPPPLRPYRQGSMRPHPNTRRGTRHNSYHPELGSPLSIANSYSTEEETDNVESTPSLTESFGSSEDSNRLQMARTRESCDENYTGYLLTLAAEQAEEQLRERQLREQELVAYVNSDFHNPVSHFYDLESEVGSDEDGPILLPHEQVARKQSTVSGFTAAELQQHEETLARMRAEETFRKVAEEAAQPSFHDPFWTNGITNDKGVLPIDPKDEELKVMREAASPPMLGEDLLFRMCPSPKFTKFETDQRIEAPPPKNADGGGLWGGYCVAEDASQCIAPHHRHPNLLETPDNERDDPFNALNLNDGAAAGPKGHPSPSKGMHMLSGLDERLKGEVAKAKLEDAICVEFNDTFVTQVYNYLSLGYPMLAREYDEELSHISRIPESQLRSDDDVKAPVGNVGIKAGTGLTDATGAVGVGTPRWMALKRYIHEWARQHPNLSTNSAEPIAWGVRARRGSWAI
ncbi:hypothetical protein V495_04884 [Pseudogymnoascus sp. VKM F-4514 (FW-929)]|nr:hypothetical protein V495_04884 [Pseudogymnoascus sp. VKM F-4514 (FW-929)]KFY54953.1 hypothetical protein V497_07304 [Pseudogymnoascus sp. VKM F-4516 (FW-969)]